MKPKELYKKDQRISRTIVSISTPWCARESATYINGSRDKLKFGL